MMISYFNQDFVVERGTQICLQQIYFTPITQRTKGGEYETARSNRT